MFLNARKNASTYSYWVFVNPLHDHSCCRRCNAMQQNPSITHPFNQSASNWAWACTLTVVWDDKNELQILASRTAQSKRKRETWKQLWERVKPPSPPALWWQWASRLLPHQQCLCRARGQGTRSLWLSQHRHWTARMLSYEGRKSASSKVSCVLVHLHYCLALCNCSQP